MGISQHLSDLTGTTIIALWGAIVATIVLFWDVYKWRTSGEKIRLTVSPDMVILNDPNVNSNKSYVSAKAENYGKRATTITSLGLRYYPSFHNKLFSKPNKSYYVQPLTYQNLPLKVDPGTDWIGMLEQTPDIVKMAREGYLYCVVSHSNKKRPTRKRIIIKKNDIENKTSSDSAKTKGA